MTSLIPLGNTEIKVSKICLGTMTWGKQNTEQEAFEQLDYALDAGINFLDTAEMYAIPPTAETYGKTETIIGHYFQRRKNRDQWVVASKVVGPGRFDHIRDGQLRLDRKNIEAAIDTSLSRLQLDYLDLYQLHWPDRQANFFGKLGFAYPDGQEQLTPIEETLQVLEGLVNAGKIRSIGLSNETPWGTMRFLQIAEQMGFSRIVSIQNPYNLLNRSFEVGLAEISYRENVGLLAYSPLAFGALSGKYLGGSQPEGARLTLFREYVRYTNELAVKATQSYCDLAREHDLDPAQMALAFVNQQPFVTSNIIGATTMEQLRANIASLHIELSDELIERINQIHKQIPNPSP